MASAIISWALTVCLLAAAVYVYKPNMFNGLRSQAQEAKQIIAEPTKPAKKSKSKPKLSTTSKAKGEEEADSGSANNKKRKIASASASKTALAAAPQGQKASLQDVESGLSDKDFAKQLAQTQSNNGLQVPQKPQPSKKDRRASKLATAGSPDPSDFSAEASSTNGRDGDDDLTPMESPETLPVDTTSSRAGDVSDMLEAPSAKPTTLRLTDISSDSKAKKPAAKAFEPVLSKKKRNEKQRKEEQRLAREESDRIHEAKKQEQLRRARMAAGTSNQTKANNFAAKTSAWQSGPSDTVRSAPATDVQPLLDTFNPSSFAAAPTNGSVHTAATGATDAGGFKSKVGENVAAAMTASASREGFASAPRQEFAGEQWEQDQLKMLKEQEQGSTWESVTSKKSKKKGRHDTDSAASGASSPVRAAAVVPANPKINGNRTENGSKKVESINRFESFQDRLSNGLQNAEWEA